jgi:hypothetical protein
MKTLQGGRMKKVFIGIYVLSFIMICSVSSAQIGIDVTGSHVDIQDSTTIRVHNVTSPEAPGSYWIDFQWDPFYLVFVPINLGQEPTIGKTWTVSYSDDSPATATIKVTENLTDRVLQFQITVLSGGIDGFEGYWQNCYWMPAYGPFPSTCSGEGWIGDKWVVAQGQNSFQPSLKYPDSQSLPLYTGQTAKGTFHALECGPSGLLDVAGFPIESCTDVPFPQWFDFNSPFGLTLILNDSEIDQTSSWILK